MKILSLRNGPNSRKLLCKETSGCGEQEAVSAGQQRQGQKESCCPYPQGAPRLVTRELCEQRHAVRCGGAHLFSKGLWDHRGGAATTTQKAGILWNKLRAKGSDSGGWMDEGWTKSTWKDPRDFHKGHMNQT